MRSDIKLYLDTIIAVMVVIFIAISFFTALFSTDQKRVTRAENYLRIIVSFVVGHATRLL